MYPFCILETPFVIVFESVVGYGYNPERSLLQRHVYTYAHISAPKEFPDMIFDAFEVTFMINTRGYLRLLVDLPKTIQTNQTNAPEIGSPPAQARVLGAAASSPEKHLGVA